MRSISKSQTDCNYQQPVITFRFVPINWQDGSQSHIAIVDEPQPVVERLDDAPLVINWPQRTEAVS